MIALEKLSLSYDGKTIVVHELDLSIAPGTVTALVGPNGCGKSTLLRGVSPAQADAWQRLSQQQRHSQFEGEGFGASARDSAAVSNGA